MQADPNSSVYQQTYKATRAEIAAERRATERAIKESSADYDRRAFAADQKKGDGGHGRIKHRSVQARCTSCFEFFSFDTIRDYERVASPDTCPLCKAPRHVNDGFSLYVKKDPFDKPYFDTDLGRDVKGAKYVEGLGVYIEGRAHAERVAALNNRPIRPEYR